MINSGIITQELKILLGLLLKNTTVSLWSEISFTKETLDKWKTLSAALLAKWRKDNAQDMHNQACWIKNRFQLCFQKHSLQNSQVYLFELLVTSHIKSSYSEDFSSCSEQNTVCQFTFDTLKYFLKYSELAF